MEKIGRLEKIKTATNNVYEGHVVYAPPRPIYETVGIHIDKEHERI